MPEYRVSGAFFENTKGGPKYTGFVEIEGVRTKIALWPKVSAKGDNYLQCSEDKKKDAGPAAGGGGSPFKPRARPIQGNDPRGSTLPDIDDEILFAPEFR